MATKQEWKEMYTKSDLKGLGFTESMMEDLLPKPILKTNPKYKSAPQMKLWNMDVVNEVMESEEFKNRLKARERRIKAAQKAVATKQNEFIHQVDLKIEEIEVFNLDISDADLRQAVLREKDDYYRAVGKFTGILTEKSVDSQTIDRWVVNHIRHYYTTYDSEVYEMKGYVGKNTGYLKYQEAVLNKIAETYPKYKEECLRQIERKRDTYLRYEY